VKVTPWSKIVLRRFSGSKLTMLYAITVAPTDVVLDRGDVLLHLVDRLQKEVLRDEDLRFVMVEDVLHFRCGEAEHEGYAEETTFGGGRIDLHPLETGWEPMIFRVV
jgi:hypothetical protein